jgi:hypothetical protein
MFLDTLRNPHLPCPAPAISHACVPEHPPSFQLLNRLTSTLIDVAGTEVSEITFMMNDMDCFSRKVPHVSLVAPSISKHPMEDVQ